ncbi:ubiquinone/menaquinone biosynthesis methyltransferase UBIE [Sporolactobacillus inulinus]|uniref:Ubiquinone/menaquinone biosynthesis methyltransferase UBIE n=1 Tax=Sporolactobacillus inulinus TaxID=2078 RepID=A0A4Y1ZGK8_9BACL|nr:ubiquinone/menaquinone biosynthesis methyltransferase UBIE [Sporolactobacillus inulinus]
MKQNKYDDVVFFSEYEKMPRSVKGLEGAGEWPVIKAILPELKNKNVLDLGCGFGWHCRYAREQQASSVIGVDISEKMLQKARKMTDDSAVSCIKMPIEDINFSDSQFDVVISSLAFHYVKSFEIVCQKVLWFFKSQEGLLFFLLNILFLLLGTNKIGIMITMEIAYIGLLTIISLKACVIQPS